MTSTKKGVLARGMRRRARWHRDVAMPRLEAKFEKTKSLPRDEFRHYERMANWQRAMTLKGMRP